MKKLILAVAICCAFCAHGIATNSDTKLNNIERLEEKINALKAEREVIENKYRLPSDELMGALKKKVALRDKITNLEFNHKAYTDSYFKDLLEKSENDFKIATLHAAEYKFLLDINKINLSIDKANIELIKAEIKAGEKPRVPLDVAKALIESTKSSVKLSEVNVKAIEVKTKEKEANIRYFKNIVEGCEKENEIRKNTNDSLTHIYNINIELAELAVKEAMLKLKLKHMRRETVQAEIKKQQAVVEYLKTEHKLRNIYLKFNKVLDEKNLSKFRCHN
jgi:hypothetical protein